MDTRIQDLEDVWQRAEQPGELGELGGRMLRGGNGTVTCKFIYDRQRERCRGGRECFVEGDTNITSVSISRRSL